MASIIKIKRSTGTSAPSSLKSGELAYSYGAGTAGNGGDRLYFGKGDDGNGTATSIVQIGGEWYKNLLDHTAGTLTASSAIITDASNKIDQLNVDNLTIDGNTISSTNTNGDIVLDPNGTGKVDVSNAKIQNLGAPTTGTDAATKAYVDQVSGAALFTVNGDTGTDTVNLQDSDITFKGGIGVTTTVTDNQVEVAIDSTGVIAGTYGSNTEIPIFTVNAFGQIDSAGTVSVTHSFDITDGTNTDTFSTGGTLTFTGTAPITTTVANDQVTIAANNATTTTKGVASFSSDNFSVASGAVTIKDGGVSNDELANSSISINNTSISLGDSVTITTDGIYEGSNLYYTDARARGAVSVTDNGGDGSLSYSSGTGVFTYTGPSASETRAHFSGGTGVSIVNGEISIGQPVDSTDDVIFNSVNTNGDIVIGGNLTVQGTTTTVNTVTMTTRDALIHLADSNDTTDAVDIGFMGHYYSSANSRIEHTGLFRDATDGRYYLFSGLADDDLEDSLNVINRSGTGYTAANLTVGDLYANTINAQLTGSYAGFDSDFNNQNTDNLDEGGNNRYYTTERLDSDLADILIAGTGISITNGTGTYTIGGTNAAADGSTKGIATFASANFSAASGVISSKDVTITTGSGSKAFTLGASFNLNGNSTAGITTSVSGGNIEVSAAAATNLQRGTASFDANNFSVTSGAVSIAEVDGGTF